MKRASEGMTEKQEAVYQFIKSYIESKGYSPSMTDIANRFSITPVCVRSIYLLPLQKKGYVTFEPGKGRTLRVLK